MATIEQELFSWQGWDGNAECMTFYKPTLKVQIGKYPKGTVFDVAFIMQTNRGCVLQLANNDTTHPTTDHYLPTWLMGEYRLHYRIGETLNERS